jgi:hypothetical protein
MIYFGVSALIASVPSFVIAAPDGWTIFWAIALTLGGAIGALGSVARLKIFERLELIGASLVTLTVGSYALILLFLAYFLGDAGRASSGAGMVALTAPILVRTLWLASQTLRK